jgi:hypothetical protein
MSLKNMLVRLVNTKTTLKTTSQSGTLLLFLLLIFFSDLEVKVLICRADMIDMITSSIRK